MWRLTPDANFSRNVSFHVVKDPKGARRYVARYMGDIIEYVALVHPNGILVEAEGEWYIMTLQPASRSPTDG